MPKVAVESEYEDWEGGVRHKPTGIRVWLAYQNVEGGWTQNNSLDDPGEYDAGQVRQLGGAILVRRKN